jgi:polyribonucleotide nucleotidyltransferase
MGSMSSSQPGVLNMSPMMAVGATGTMQQTIEVHKPMVGKLIGKGGDTINIMQKKSGCKMQIEQNCTPCLVIMTGTPQVYTVQ